MKENWTYKKLGEVATFSRGLTYSKNDTSDYSEVQVLRSNNIDLETHKVILDDIACLKPDFVIPNEKKLKKNDIFICMSNGSTQHLGKIAFIDSDMEFAFGGFMGAIHPNIEKVFPKYLFYSCISQGYRYYLDSILNGANINNLKWSSLCNFLVPVPPLAEQERIVEELDLLSGVIEKQKQQLKELDTLAQSIFYDTFGDPITNEKNWETSELGQKCAVTSSKRVLVQDVINEGIPFIRGTELTQLNKANSSDEVKFSMFISEEHYQKLKAITGVPKIGDILIPSINSEGISWIVDTDKPFYFKDGRVLWVHVNTDIFTSRYLKYIISIILKSSYNTLTSGATFLELKLFIIRELLIPIPPLSLQEEFAEKIEMIEKQKEAIGKSIKETQLLFDYTMDKYFG